jgi:hypothetical protein
MLINKVRSIKNNKVMNGIKYNHQDGVSNIDLGKAVEKTEKEKS